MYFAYVLYSEDYDRLYIGQTNDLVNRLEAHNNEQVRSTKAYTPWKLIHFEEFKTRSDAMQREKELKSHKGRLFIRSRFLS